MDQLLEFVLSLLKIHDLFLVQSLFFWGQSAFSSSLVDLAFQLLKLTLQFLNIGLRAQPLLVKCQMSLRQRHELGLR